MRPHHIIFLGLLFVAGTLISLVIGGAWFGDEDIETINSLAVMREVNVGIWALQVPNLSYFTIGITRLVSFDFAFFGGGYGIFLWILLFTIGVATMWGIFTILIGVASTLFSRR